MTEATLLDERGSALSLNLTNTLQDDIIAASSIFVVAVVGISTNAMSAITVFKLDHLRNAFGYSCASHAIGSLGVLCVFAFWAGPSLILQHHALTEISSYWFLADTAGQLTIFFYYGGIFTNILITINRCFVITWPALYAKYFNTHMTLRYILFIWIFAFIYSCVYRIPGCHFFFNSGTYMWNYSNSLCGFVISTYLECCVNSLAVIFIILMDSFIFYKLRVMNKSLQATGSSALSATEQQMRRKREIRFFLQACCSESTYLIAVANFYGFIHFAQSQWAAFIMTTMFWALFHTVDGIILVAFNRDVKMCCGKEKRKKSKEANKMMMTVKPRMIDVASRVKAMPRVSGGNAVSALRPPRSPYVVTPACGKTVVCKALSSST